MHRSHQLGPIGLLIGLALIFGCDSADRLEISPETDISRYADLPFLRQTHDPQLKAELARLIGEGATPAQLVAAASHSNRQNTSADDAVTSELIALFPEELRVSLGKELDELYPVGPLRFTNEQLTKAVSFEKQHSRLREQYRAVLSDLELVVDHRRGLGADLSFVEAAQIGNRLEALAGGCALEHSGLDEAIESLQVLNLMNQKLSHVNHLVPRLAAAHLRAESLRLLEAVVHHPNVTEKHYRQLHDLLSRQLQEWASDKTAWIGERAEGLHVYELIRDGHLLSVLTYDEIRELDDKEALNSLATGLSRNVDRDELLYLRWMRRIIEACDRPFYLRQSALRDISRQLDLLKDRAGYPFIAAEILLLDTLAAHRQMAVDRARTEAWTLALAVALEIETEEWNNPLTGYPYIVDADDERVIVDAIQPGENEPMIRVPRLRVNPTTSGVKL